MTVLLTGGAGYIGSHTAVELLQENYDVIIVDDLSNSNEIVIDRIEKITSKRPKFYKFDICDKQYLNNIFSENEIDVVIHFAGFKSVGESVRNPLKYYKNNLDSTLSLLEVMKVHGVNKIIFSSSATVYGMLSMSPCVESMPRGECTNPYGWTKSMIEQILQDCVISNSKLSVVALRYFNPVGAHSSGLIGEKPNGVPNNLMPYICQVASGKLERLNIFGGDYETKDGTGIRDYIHVVDLAKGHVKAIDFLNNMNYGFEPINLGTGVGYSVLEIVKTFETVNNISVPYSVVSRREGDLAEVYSDPSKAKSLLNWEARKELDDMCRDSWNWEKSNLIINK